MRADHTCISCMIEKQDKLIQKFDDEEKKSDYMFWVRELLNNNAQNESAPWLAEQIDILYNSYWGELDYTSLKHKYNQLLLDKEQEVERRIRKSDDTIKECIKYICAGNYIDFSAVENVSEQTFEKLLDKAAQQSVSEEEYSHFISDLESARKLVYLTDNCGEIVLDKLFMRFMQEQYPSLQIHAIVRGRDVINDATLNDAREVGLTEIVPCVGNENGAPGSVIKRFGKEARQLLLEADLVISKGQGNFESLFGEGINPYYFFLCKCDLFVRRFGLKQYESVFIKEERVRSLM